ncbi:MAG: cation-translocating P-type ATPase family protein, partial [Isosphaeraceae bacterium]
ARLLRDGQETEVEVDDIAPGDVLLVRPGERIAADGTVRRGRTAVDQSILTGESLPVDVGPGDRVFTGSINQFGQLEVAVEQVGSQTTMGRVIELLTEAQQQKAPLERTADKLARRFLPTVLTATLLVFLATNARTGWGWFRDGTAPSIDVMPALAVLVVACPCGLVLATPAAVLAATARLARLGVLVKSGAALERLAQVDTIALDKTGTLTEGRPELVDRVALSPWNADDLLAIAAAAEQPSEHPLARLLVAEAARSERTLPAALDFQAHPGVGVAAQVPWGDDRRNVLVGNLRLIREQEIPVPAEIEEALARFDETGQTVLLVAVNGTIAGAIGARDKVRPEAHDVVQHLRHLGITDLTLLTGDRPAPARDLARKVHLTQIESEKTPADKAHWVHHRQHEGRVVAMVGDGINDAPALAMADVGLALGGVGADVAAEAGSVVLMGDPLVPLPQAIRLARQTVKIIRQNILGFAFGLNGVAIVLAGLRILGPVAAAVFHQIGSLLVLLNAMRLLGFERWGELAPLRATSRFVQVCRRCRPGTFAHWAEHHRRGLSRTLCGAAVLFYLASGITVIGPDQLGVLERFGRFVPPLLGPGLHVRFPSPIETVAKVEPGLVRSARIGIPSDRQGDSPVDWSASHGVRRAEAALFFTGDENLVELGAQVEYIDTEAGVADRIFGAVNVEETVLPAAEAVVRETVGKTPLEAILVTDRDPLEQALTSALQDRLARVGLHQVVERVRIVDAHPPREVVPAYREVSAAVSDAERYHNEALAYAAEQALQGKAEAQSIRDQGATRASEVRSRSEGESGAFLFRQAAYAEHPELAAFRLLWRSLGNALANRPKLVLDPRIKGRRHVWMADPTTLGAGKLDSLPVRPADVQPESND